MKVNIIGKGHGWEGAPHEGECWGINHLILRRPVSRLIAMDEENIEELRPKIEKDKILYRSQENYPLQEVMDFFDTDYFSNSVDYAIALAIYEGFDEIDLYGVNMAVDSEYAYEKAGVDFWCGVAKGKGVKVNVHGEQSTIMKTRDGFLYGYAIPQKSSILGALCR